MTATDIDGLTDTTYFSVTTGPTVGGASASIDAESGAWTYTPSNAELVRYRYLHRHHN